MRDTEYEADAVIVSTGAQSLMLGLEAEPRLLGHGLSTCATCDGFFFRGQQIAVVGGGDSAIEEAMFLTKFADKVTLDPPPRRAAGLEDHAGPGVRQPEDRVPVEHRRRPTSSATTRSRAPSSATSDRRDLDAARHRLFVAIGHRPNTDLFAGVLDMDENGYLITQPGSTYTNVEGVFACGDVQDHTYRQAITAAGSGCMAAIDAERWLEANGTPHRPRRVFAARRRNVRRPRGCTRYTRRAEPRPTRRMPAPWPESSNLSTTTFDETVDGADKPVVVDFWAEWCGPCKMIAPILDELAAELGDRVTVAKVNVDDNPDLAMRYNVMSIPTLLVFSGGEVHKRLVGAKGKGPAAPGARRIPRYFPLTRGQHGEAIRDLQRRLGAAGFPRRRRGRRVLCRRPRPPCGRSSATAACTTTGSATSRRGWRSSRPRGASATVRSLVAPNLRGDDVAELQAGSAGSASTAAASTASSARPRPALEDFQRNCGLDVDGICGPATVRALEVNAPAPAPGPAWRRSASSSGSDRRASAASCASSSASSAASGR